MARLVLIVLGLFLVLWLVLMAGILPAPIAAPLAGIVYGAMSLALPLFFLSIYLAPGLFLEMRDVVWQSWERLRTRRDEIDQLLRKINHLDRPHHMLQLGAVYARQGRVAQAAEWFRRALDKEPDSLDAQYRLALCLYQQGEYSQAMELLERVHAAKPDHDYGQAYLRLAQSHQQLGNWDRASEVYERFLRYYPGQPEGCYHYAILQEGRQNRARAAELMQELIFSVHHSPRFQRRRNRHWAFKARWWLWRRR
jgi:tetratricopeptide (TPR) repeat protein